MINYPCTMYQQKREYDAIGHEANPNIGGGEIGGGDSKRFKSDEITGARDPTLTVTRLLMSKIEFSKLIGKKGLTVSNIRSITGCNVRGTNTDDDHRLVLVDGPFQKLMAAFDMISEVMNNSSSEETIFTIAILIEHSKVGRLVGAKGATIQLLCQRSGCINMRIEKDPKEYCGVELRKLTIEGSLSAIRRAHYSVHVLYTQFDNAYPTGGYNTNFYNTGPRQPMVQQPMYALQPQPPMLQAHLQNQDRSVPFKNLTEFGLQMDTVNQLSEMKSYLLTHFRLNLAVFHEGGITQYPPHALQTHTAHITYTKPPEKLNLQETIATRSQKLPPSQEMCFGVPKNCVGAIIGKGGNILKDMQANLRVRIHVEKGDYGGMRLVVLTAIIGIDAIEDENEKILAFERCRSRIYGLVQEQEAALSNPELKTEDV